MSLALDNEALIYCVEARPALWHALHKDHKNRTKTRLLWAEVAARLLPGVPGADTVVQKRWKSLRDKFRRLLTAQVLAQKNDIKTEEGTDVTAADDVSWKYFEQLAFLKDSLTRLPNSHKLNHSGVTAEEAVSAVAPYVDVDSVSLLSVESNQDAAPAASLSTESPEGASDVSDQELAATDELPARMPTPQPRQRKRRKVDDGLQQQLEEVSRLLSDYKPPDADEYFALSLVGHMRKVKPSKKLDMQLEILNLMQKYKEH
ncbi:hypothetical protein V5799_026911 [Amblyomma americanum]|uniref:Alcohol dehydrogenase transcription factor myb/sant-like protein n=1 Tax=Amblyomma americanum TaxID=6943 RepID=A0AAQ4DH80_AMBAM